MEVENKDPLGRYNAGLYGYNLTMPTAVIQNAHYRENAFEGFEDYGFATLPSTSVLHPAKVRASNYYKYEEIEMTLNKTGTPEQ